MTQTPRRTPIADSPSEDGEYEDTQYAAFERDIAKVSYQSSVAPLPHIGQVVAGKYRMDRLLGCGGMGAVFAATHLVTERPFAIKWLLPNLAAHPEAVQRFQREAKASGKITHPNVIQVYDVGEDSGSFYILMELITGVTLAERLRERGRLGVAEACGVLIPVMRGVQAAHQLNVIHRDLKPQNIMLEQTDGHPEVPKVLDFGISKLTDLGDDTASLSTRQGMVIGTPHYMSLEQLRSAPVDARSDVYALGVILYHTLSGQLPYHGTNPADLVCQLLSGTAAPLDSLVPGVPAGLVQVVERAMAVEPKDRFGSVEELAKALEPFADGIKLTPGASGARADDTPMRAATTSGEPGERRDAPAWSSAAAVGLEPSAQPVSLQPSAAADRGGLSTRSMLWLAAVALSGAAVGAAMVRSRSVDPLDSPPAQSQTVTQAVLEPVLQVHGAAQPNHGCEGNEPGCPAPHAAGAAAVAVEGWEVPEVEPTPVPSVPAKTAQPSVSPAAASGAPRQPSQPQRPVRGSLEPRRVQPQLPSDTKRLQIADDDFR